MKAMIGRIGGIGRIWRTAVAWLAGVMGLTGLVGCENYRGPSVRVGAGYNGAEISFTLYERADPLGEAAAKLKKLTDQGVKNPEGAALLSAVEDYNDKNPALP